MDWVGASFRICIYLIHVSRAIQNSDGIGATRGRTKLRFSSGQPLSLSLPSALPAVSWLGSPQGPAYNF
jgi:hypothetical protein